MLYLNLYYLGSYTKYYWQGMISKNLRILWKSWLLKYFMRLLEDKLCILNTFNLWAFDLVLPLCYYTGDYPIFVTASVWRVNTPSLWRVIILSFWWWTKLEHLSLHDAGKSLSVWVRPLPIRPKDHMKKGYGVTHHSLLPMGKEVNPWVCGWG